MFRRRTSEDENAAALAALTPPTDATAGKGRPTPKRSEAEANRAARMRPPKDRKEALKIQREKAKSERLKSRAALVGGDERYLPARDRGPVRRFVRDFIDARRTIGEFFLFLGLGIVVLSFLDNPTIVGWATSAWLAILVVLLGEAFWLGSRLKRELATRFPEARGPHQGRKGAVFYGIMRSLQMRRLRLPKPQVKPGTPV